MANHNRTPLFLFIIAVVLAIVYFTALTWEQYAEKRSLVETSLYPANFYVFIIVIILVSASVVLNGGKPPIGLKRKKSKSNQQHDHAQA